MEVLRVIFRSFALVHGGEAEASLIVHADGMDEVELNLIDTETPYGYLVAVPEGADASLELVESVTRLPLNGEEGMDVTGEPLVVNQSFDLRTGELGSDAIDFYQEVPGTDRWTHDSPTKALDCTLVDGEYKDGCRVSVQLLDASVSRFSWDGGGSWSVGDEGSGAVAVRLLPGRSTIDASSVPEGESLGTWTVELHTADGDLASEPQTLDAESLTTSGLFIFNVDDLGDRRFVVQVEPSDQGSVRYEDGTVADFELSFGD